MLKVYQTLHHYHGPVHHQVVLSYELRKKARIKAQTEDKQDIGFFLERGQVLQNGQFLEAENGEVVEIKSADELVTTAYSDNPLMFAKVCYHLGNRHTPLQVGKGWVRFQPDHVLQDLVELYGLRVEQHQGPFDPETGAYHSHLPAHSH
ncbi:urease accessory protein UreE [Agarivorans sp. Toyoura001]|uniref:urease accessory protein UreE n=1 Tax=Agarivorans sp. Toyoura001 TaxID=2283141 RepID=UPI0010E549E4|nr:urease accessory protein UreE [Agarivorans sp. Toyoura001]GDY27018.1 urease accessory protein UreE [Agarivorans sp. Toyoura001]